MLAQKSKKRICPNILEPERVQTKNVSKQKVCEKLSYKKAARKMLLKLTPGVNYKSNIHVNVTAFFPINLDRHNSLILNCFH